MICRVCDAPSAFQAVSGPFLPLTIFHSGAWASKCCPLTSRCMPKISLSLSFSLMAARRTELSQLRVHYLYFFRLPSLHGLVSSSRSTSYTCTQSAGIFHLGICEPPLQPLCKPSGPPLGRLPAQVGLHHHTSPLYLVPIKSPADNSLSHRYP